MIQSQVDPYTTELLYVAAFVLLPLTSGGMFRIVMRRFLGPEVLDDLDSTTRTPAASSASARTSSC